MLLNGSIPSCGEGALACSCGDCPAGPNCEPPLPPPPPEPPGCPAVGTTRLTCTDLWLAVLYVALLACLPLVVWRSRQQLEEGELRRSQEAEAGGGRPSVAAAGSGGHDSMERVEGAAGAAGDCDAGAHAARVGGGGSQDVGAVRNGGAGSKPSLRAAAAGADQQGEIEEEVAEVEEELVEWPATEQLLRRWFYRLGRGCASRPWRVLAASLLLVGACIAGLGRFRWVPAGWSRRGTGSWAVGCATFAWQSVALHGLILQPGGLVSKHLEMPAVVAACLFEQRTCCDLLDSIDAWLAAACTHPTLPVMPAPIDSTVL